MYLGARSGTGGIDAVSWERAYRACLVQGQGGETSARPQSTSEGAQETIISLLSRTLLRILPFFSYHISSVFVPIHLAILSDQCPIPTNRSRSLILGGRQPRANEHNSRVNRSAWRRGQEKQAEWPDIIQGKRFAQRASQRHGELGEIEEPSAQDGWTSRVSKPIQTKSPAPAAV